jgi:xanthine dehydrogenase accessory factor
VKNDRETRSQELLNTQDFYRMTRDLVGAGKHVASATVIRTKGSTPREVGAKMLVLTDGTVHGTIGGGCGEAEVVEAALEVLGEGETGSTRLVRVDLTEDIVEAAERICGGVMDVLVEIWDRPCDELERLATGDGVIRVVRTSGRQDRALTGVYSAEAADADWDAPVSEQCEVALRSQTSHSGVVQTSAGEVELFYEYVSGGSTLVIVGAGHIAQPLSRLAKLLGFRIVVLDDRPEFASSERFPDADRVIAEPLASALDRLDLSEETMVVLVTRGHRFDEFCLRRLLDSPALYLGMLGSKRRVRAVFSSLLADGYTEKQLERVWAPIGIDIGARSPVEIAVSIVAELVAVKRERSGSHLKILPHGSVNSKAARGGARLR